jgi:lipoprotein-anchoring transpeptidase ErfK/SrfK
MNAVALVATAFAFALAPSVDAIAGPPSWRDASILDDPPAASAPNGDDSRGAAGPWFAGGDLPPEWVTAVRVLRADEAVMSTPSSSSARRGSAAKEARLPLFGSRSGPGCRARWLSVGPNAWMCGDHVELSRGAPIPASAMTHPPSSDGLPFRYYFVGPDGSYGYRRVREIEVGNPDMQLDAGFAVAVVEERSLDGASYGHTGADLWVPMRDLAPARPLGFSGEVLEPATRTSIPFGWVVAKEAELHRSASLASRLRESVAQFLRVEILEESTKGEPMYRVGPDRWLRAKDVRRPTMAPPPPEVDVEAKERWVDVELATQTLVAYEGDRAVFATLLSSGKGRPGSGNETRKGTFRIWAKLDTAHMDNLEQENANRYYRMENVPWVQFFDKGIGLHGAYWHRSFGNVRSHGCINLAPLDAQRLFSFTTPRLPAGWTAVLPSDGERGSVVRVR